MYTQYIKEIETELGLMKFEYTFKNNELDSLLITYNNKTIECPKQWARQTSKTIIRKIVSMENN